MADARFMNVRIGDAERDESVILLAEHFTAGRMSPAEHEERRSAAKIAITRSEIEILFQDLPAPHPDMTAAEPPPLSQAELAAVAAKRETPLSGAMDVTGGLALFLGLPAGIVVGFVFGLWWVLAPVVGLIVVALALGELFKKPVRQD
jgi:hypothetical protein